MKELAKPRMAMSARIAELNQDHRRIQKQPSTPTTGTADKVIPFLRPSQTENAQIPVDMFDHTYRDLLNENAPADENNNEVRLKKGAHVEATITDKAIHNK